jgi:hypothetical protein
VQSGLVTGLSQPGGNLTGAARVDRGVSAEAARTTARVAARRESHRPALVNPTNPNAETLSRAMRTAARTFGLELQVLHASSEVPRGALGTEQQEGH